MPILSRERIAAGRDVAEVYDPDLNPSKGPTDTEIPLSFLERGLGKYYFASTTPGTSGVPFQLRPKCANDKVDRLVLWYWLGGSIPSWTTLNRKVDVVCGSFPLRGSYEVPADFGTLTVESISNRCDDILEFELAKKLRLVSKDTVARIKGFTSLDDNWDSYGARAIERSTITKAIRFFSVVVSRLPENAPLPFVAPACDGNIHFEWEMISKALKHSIPEEENAPWEYLLIDKTSGRIRREPGKATNMQEMIEIVIDVLGSHAAK